ncbi:MAG TPA: carboxypeptidase-like regulatory domain-containing protein, partial [Chryseosolibacter sp.]
MKKYFSFLIILFSTAALAQEVKSRVTGVITDVSSGTPLSGVNVKVENGSETFSGTTNESGKFSIETGADRYKITASYTGYHTFSQEILTIAAKDLTLNISLGQSVQQLQEVEVESSALQSELAGQRSLTIEKTLRIPANFFDP